MAGDYRHVLIKPQDLSWQIQHYDDVTTALTLSDLDRLREEILPPPQSGRQLVTSQFILARPLESFELIEVTLSLWLRMVAIGDGVCLVFQKESSWRSRLS